MMNSEPEDDVWVGVSKKLIRELKVNHPDLKDYMSDSSEADTEEMDCLEPETILITDEDTDNSEEVSDDIENSAEVADDIENSEGPPQPKRKALDVQVTKRKTTNSRVQPSNKEILIYSDDENEPQDMESSSVKLKAAVEKFKLYHGVPKRKESFKNIERRIMLYYLISKHAIWKAKGYEIWKQMIAEGILQHRTYQSLHNQYVKKILKHIEDYEEVIGNKRHFRVFRSTR